MSTKNRVVALSAVRTPIGAFGKSLHQVQAIELGKIAITAAVERAHITSDQIDDVILGHCRQAGNGPNPARSAALLAHVPETTPASTVNMACPSGMKAIMMGRHELLCGDANLVVVGGMDSMSTIPHMVRGLRFTPVKMGDIRIEDGWNDATDPVNNCTMGQTALLLAKETGITRQQQDEYALLSHQRAVAAANEGKLDAELVSINLAETPKRRAITLNRDETPRPETSLEKLACLKPAFDQTGPVTAGNSSAMSDGACALVLSTTDNARQRHIPPLFSIVAAIQTAVNGALMGNGPAIAIPMVLKKAKMSLSQMDIIEINEAFAVQILANLQALKLDPQQVNIHGGAIALGHPTGISGARIVVTAAHALRTYDKEFALCAICGAGGVTTAMIIKREQ